MKRQRTFITVCITTLAAAVIGCDRDKPDRPPAAATTQSSNTGSSGAATAPSDQAMVTTAPAVSDMTIDGALVHFPPARLRVRKDDQARVALLYSAKPDRKGDRTFDHDANSYYLQMDLGELPEGENGLNDASWAFKATTSDPVDSPNGIFLDGTEHHLQPQDVVVQFEQPQTDSPYVTVYLAGRFLLVEESEDSLLGHFVNVTATLTARVDPQ